MYSKIIKMGGAIMPHWPPFTNKVASLLIEKHWCEKY